MSEDIKALWNSSTADKCNQNASQRLQVPGYLQHSSYRSFQRYHRREAGVYSLSLFVYLGDRLGFETSDRRVTR